MRHPLLTWLSVVVPACLGLLMMGLVMLGLLLPPSVSAYRAAYNDMSGNLLKNIGCLSVVRWGRSGIFS